MTGVSQQAKKKVWLLAIMAMGVFLVIAGSRLLLLKHFGTDIPQFDAWGIEGDTLYKPYLNGTLRPVDFFAPCNEHRVVLTRLYSLTLLIVNGLWDNRMQTVVNALLYSATGAMLFWLVARMISSGESIFWAGVILATFSLPFGWENALWGFQSQFYLLVLFSLAVIYFGEMPENLKLRTFVLLGALQCAALFTMASGVLASIALFATSGIVLLRSRSDHGRRNDLIVHMGITAAVIIFWKLAVYYPVAGHDHLKAQTAAAFIEVLARCLSWPLISSEWWWVIAWLPFGIILFRFLLGKGAERGIDRFVICMGIWVLLQAFATAYSRNPKALISKYADPLSFGMLANGLALLLLYGNSGRLARKIVALVAICWTVGNAYALYGNFRVTLGWHLPEKQRIFDIQLQKTRDFLVSGDLEYLIPQGKHEIPDRDVDTYARRLTDPEINPILPRSINYEYQMSGKPYAFLSRFSDIMLAGSKASIISGFLLIAVFILSTIKSSFRKKSNNE
jgi:hypothetical protein